MSGKTRVGYVCAATVAGVMLIGVGGAANAVPFFISQDGPYIAIDATSVTAKEWTLATAAKAIPNSNGTPANISFLFEYADPQNYYYANLSTADAPNLSGLYRVTAGRPVKLSGYSKRLNLNQSYKVELRKRGGQAKLFLDGVYLAKADDTNTAPAKVGVSTVRGNAYFGDVTLTTTTTRVLNPVLVGSPTPTPPPTTAPSSGRRVEVATSAQLKAAIADARAGDTIVMADGVYTGSTTVGKFTGSFAATADGTGLAPITLTGSRNAVIAGNGTGGAYGLYLSGANYWNLDGFTVTKAGKGIVLDGSGHVLINGVGVTNIGQEAVHFRAFSSDNTIKASQINGTGKVSPQYGEGVYIGSANSNWDTYTGGLPDKSDRNNVIGNVIGNVTAEAVDIKEGSTDGYIGGNTFDGSSLSGINYADSWVDVKGNGYTIENNTGTSALVDGFQVHNVYGSWGAGNVFRGNTADVKASGYGFNVASSAARLGNVVHCNNKAINAGSGLTNLTCSEA